MALYFHRNLVPKCNGANFRIRHHPLGDFDFPVATELTWIVCQERVRDSHFDTLRTDRTK